MKKLLKVSLMAMLVATPFAANATTTLPLTYVNQAGTAYNEADKPATLTASTTVASKSYVDGAYNELAEAINTVNSNALTLSTAQTGTYTNTGSGLTSTTIGTAITELGTNKQDKIDSSHKLDADLVDDTSSTHKFVTAQDKTDLSNLKTTVGDSSSGLVKDVDDLQTAVGDSSSGLVKDVDDLQTAVGDSSAGLVKDVADLKAAGYITKDVNDLTYYTTTADMNTALGDKLDSSTAATTYATKTELANKRVEVVQTWGSATTSKVALVDNN